MTRSSTLAVQHALPAFYRTLTENNCRAHKASERDSGEKLIVLGHHYQRDEIICHCDLRGDSFKLSQQARRELPRTTSLLRRPLMRERRLWLSPISK